MTDIRRRAPKNDDWIMEKRAETAWSSLPPILQTAVPIQTVRDSLAKLTTELILAHGKTNQVFVARGEVGQFAGHVWVEEIKSGFRGAMQAYILNLYVAKELCGRETDLTNSTSPAISKIHTMSSKYDQNPLWVWEWVPPSNTILESWSPNGRGPAN